MNYTIKKLPVQKKGNKILQLKICIKEKKLAIFYNNDIATYLGIREENFENLVQHIEKIVKDKEKDKDIVSLFIINTDVEMETGSIEMRQELKAIANKQDFSKEDCQKINHLVLKDLFEKMGATKEEVRAGFGDE